MSLLDHFRKQFAYDAWANGEVLKVFRESESPDARSLTLISHILAAESLWLERLKRQPQTGPVWPQFSLDRCEQETARLALAWPEYLAALREDGLSQTIAYKNSRGENWTSVTIDVLAHVVLHSAYHRGQIASHMREIGQTPAYTDFIHGVRQGLVG
jgi:uncharacterized damage-inducible protein DinB